MTTFSSKHEKRQGLILASIALIGVLITFRPLNGRILLTQGNVESEVSVSDAASFASDLQYWDANCSHGWRSDSTCDTLVLKIQSCSVGIGSAYCSEYNTYLQQFRNQRDRISYQDIQTKVKGLQVNHEPGDLFYTGRTYDMILDL